MHLPLSAGKIVMFQSLLSDDGAFLFSVVKLEGGAFGLTRAADTFNCSCSVSVAANLLFSPLARASFSSWVFFTQLSCMSCCAVLCH